jgi:hypothetical protein
MVMVVVVVAMAMAMLLSLSSCRCCRSSPWPIAGGGGHVCGHTDVVAIVIMAVALLL